MRKDKIQPTNPTVDIGVMPLTLAAEDKPKKSVVIENAFPLTSAQVKTRIAAGQVNGEQTIRTKSVAQILRSNILTFFNFLFVVLAVLLAVFERDNFAIGDFGFMILVVINALIGTIQELRAKHTMDKLSLISAPKVMVLRDNKEQEINVSDIVMDDIVLLSTGCQICADAVVTDGSIEVNESAVTGEPDAITKVGGDELISGSYVVSGHAQAKVIHVGPDNFAMKISMGAKYFKKPNSEIWRALMTIIKIMSIVIVPLGIALFCVKHFLQDTGLTLNETVVTTIGTLIGMIPSGLVALTSAVFAVSVVRISKHHSLAQDMYCVETLARVDVLCLDKTGTITEGSMEVQDVLCDKKTSKDELMSAIRNVVSATADDNPTANALRAYVQDVDVSEAPSAVVPFSSERKWSGATIGKYSYALGAPEFVFKKMTKSMSDVVNDNAAKGYRVLALARSLGAFEGVQGNKLPKSIELMGYIFITDKIRPEAPETLRFFKEQGVTIKVISGDNPVTVRAVAMRAGLEECDNIIDMSTIKTDKELFEAAEKYSIFGRVLPDQKLKLVKALKARKHTVAMTGDGVNDVLALKAADCSIAMASGSDAAKNVSSLVLLDSNFASMPKIVAEGRRSINNLTRTASLYLMKTMYNLLIAVIFMMVPSGLPFEPSNLTLMGALTIGIPSIILALEPNSERVQGRFLPKVLAAAIPGALTVTLGVIGILICVMCGFASFTADQTQNLFIVLVTVVAFMYLFRVCLPFKGKEGIINGVMYALLAGVFAICYAVDIPIRSASFAGVFAKVGIDSNSVLKSFFKLGAIDWEMGKVLLVLASILVPIFILLVLAFNRAGKKVEKVLDERTAKMVDAVNKQEEEIQRKEETLV